VTVRAIVGGGDGTVMWVVDELQGTGVDLTNCPIGIVPFGTGNDFSRVTGWGGDSPNDVVGPNLSYLKKLAKLWTNAVTMDFDIWDIKLSTYDVESQ
jgi:diacylglycerol kinase (ATP)